MKEELQALHGAEHGAGKLEKKSPEWSDSLVLLTGTLSNLSKKRRPAPSRLSQPSPGVTGAVAIAATLMHMGSQAQAAINASGQLSWKDEADYVEFDIDANHFVGILWMMPMECGDQVKVVADKIDDSLYFAYAVQREADAVVAIYPDALMGRKERVRCERSGTLWFFGSVQIIMTGMISVQSAIRKEGIGNTLTLIGATLAVGIVVMLFFYFLGKWKFRNSIQDELAESIFTAFGWPDPPNFNLRKVSRWPNREQPHNDPPLSDPYWYLHLCYFRYDKT